MDGSAQFYDDVDEELQHLIRRMKESGGSLREVWREVAELDAACRAGSANLVYVEAVQLAAVAMWLSLCGDTELDEERIGNKLAVLRGVE